MNETKEPSKVIENDPSPDPKPDSIAPPPPGSPDRTRSGLCAWIARIAPPPPPGPDRIRFTDPFWLMARWARNRIRPPEPPPHPDRIRPPEGSKG